MICVHLMTSAGTSVFYTEQIIASQQGVLNFEGSNYQLMQATVTLDGTYHYYFQSLGWELPVPTYQQPQQLRPDVRAFTLSPAISSPSPGANDKLQYLAESLLRSFQKGFFSKQAISFQKFNELNILAHKKQLPQEFLAKYQTWISPYTDSEIANLILILKSPLTDLASTTAEIYRMLSQSFVTNEDFHSRKRATFPMIPQKLIQHFICFIEQSNTERIASDSFYTFLKEFEASQEILNHFHPHQSAIAGISIICQEEYSGGSRRNPGACLTVLPHQIICNENGHWKIPFL